MNIPLHNVIKHRLCYYENATSRGENLHNVPLKLWSGSTTHLTRLDVCQWCSGSANHSSSSRQKTTYSHWYVMLLNVLFALHQNISYLQNSKMLNLCLKKMIHGSHNILLNVMLCYIFTVYNGRACHLVFLVCFWLHFHPKGEIQIKFQKGKSKQKVKTCFEQFLCHLQIDFK